LEELVLYESLYDNKTARIWVRPKEMFFEKINLNGEERLRFAPADISYKSVKDIGPEQIENVKKIYRACFSDELADEKINAKKRLYTQQVLFLAYDQDRVIAFKWGYFEKENIFYSWLGGVLPDYRGLGVATELLKRQHLLCELEKASVIKTKTRPEFSQMLGLNLKNGFRVVGTEKKETAQKGTEQKESGYLILLEKKFA
jgi:hypothetical protein